MVGAPTIVTVRAAICTSHPGRSSKTARFDARHEPCEGRRSSNVMSSIVHRVFLVSFASLVSFTAACSRSDATPPTPTLTNAASQPAPLPPPPPPLPQTASIAAEPLPVPSSATAAETTKPKVAAVPAAPATPFIAGEAWSGSYFCGGKPSSLTLKITKSVGNNVSAIFDFKTATGKAGSFTMNGQYAPDSKHLVLNAGNWIVQPAGVVSVNLDGVTAPDAHSMAGKVIGPGCSSFMIRR